MVKFNKRPTTTIRIELKNSPFSPLCLQMAINQLFVGGELQGVFKK